MTEAMNTTGRASDAARGPSPTTARDVHLLVALEAGVILLWALWQVLGVDLTVAADGSTREVSLVAVVLTTTLVTVAALALRWALRRRGLRAWTTVAVAALVASCAGPLLATSVAAGLALLSFHLLVGVGLVVGVRRLHRMDG